MQQLLEDVTGQPFAEFMRSTVLDPLQMDHSTFEQPLPPSFAGDAATAHGGDGQPIEGKWHTYPERAAAGLWTTPSDLARYAIEVIQSSRGESNRVLSAEMTREMLTPVLNDHGLGPHIQTSDDSVQSIQFSHSGGNAGFRCFFVGYTGSRQAAVVMTNGDKGDLLMMEIIRSIARAYGWPDFRPTERSVVPVDPHLYRFYEGEYRFTDFPEFGAVIRTENERLMLEGLPDGTRYELHAESDTQFFSEEQEGSIAFVREADEKANALMINSEWKMERVK
jgi:CubicO group peptidase (beta-lactamase class C family)